jgi:rhomboid family GlyGly-CTERM serine protease
LHGVPKEPDFPVVTSLVVLVCLMLSMAPVQMINLLDFDRQKIISGQLWRLWTGHLLHFSVQHAMINALSLLAVGVIAERELGAGRFFLAFFSGALIISIGLLFFAQNMLEYRGSSGLVMLVAVADGRLLWQSRAELRLIIAICGFLLALKIMFESLGLPLDLANLPDAIQVAWQAHLLGGITGFIFASLFSNCRNP